MKRKKITYLDFEIQIKSRATYWDFLFMTIKDFIRNIEKEIPSEIAWNKDNVGLQVEI